VATVGVLTMNRAGLARAVQPRVSTRLGNRALSVSNASAGPLYGFTSRRSEYRVRSMGDGAENGEPEEKREDKISQTLADLDALLGIHEEEEKTEEETTSNSKENEAPSFEISPSVLRTMAEAEAARAKASSETDEDGLPKNVNDSIGRIVEQARKISQENGEKGTAGEEAMRKEFEQLLTVLTSPRGMDPDEIKEMKEKVFGTQTFFVTEILPTVEFDQGILVRGNFRGDKEEKFQEICKRIYDLYGTFRVCGSLSKMNNY
jgi:hypothetical protein